MTTLVMDSCKIGDFDAFVFGQFFTDADEFLGSGAHGVILVGGTGGFQHGYAAQSA